MSETTPPSDKRPAVAIPAVPPLLGLTRPAPPRSEIARVILGTLGPVSAKLGLAWLGLMGFFAVFGPFVASSHPIAMKLKGGEWEFPLLRALTPMDAILVLATFTAIIVSFCRFKALTRIGIVVMVIAISAYPAYRICKQPENIVYDKYRTLIKEGKVEAAYFTIIPYSPSDRTRDSFDIDRPHPRAPDGSHWLGTESNGADVASRMIHACRISLGVGFVATSISLTLGILIGGLMGYFSGWVDLFGMRLVEIFNAIPDLYLILAILAFWGSGSTALYLIMVVLGLLGWSGYAVFLRAEFLKLRQQPFVEAAVAAGLPLRSVIFTHMLPNGVTPVLVSASFGIAGAINVENFLSFLGIGLVEEPSWGQLLSQSTAVGGQFHWWLAVFPGNALLLTMFAFVLIGESMRDVIDPYTSKK